MAAGGGFAFAGRLVDRGARRPRRPDGLRWMPHWGIGSRPSTPRSAASARRTGDSADSSPGRLGSVEQQKFAGRRPAQAPPSPAVQRRLDPAPDLTQRRQDQRPGTGFCVALQSDAVDTGRRDATVRLTLNAWRTPPGDRTGGPDGPPARRRRRRPDQDSAPTRAPPPRWGLGPACHRRPMTR